MTHLAAALEWARERADLGAEDIELGPAEAGQLARTLLALDARVKALQPLWDVVDDEFCRNVAGYAYNVPRIHRAIERARQALDDNDTRAALNGGGG